MADLLDILSKGSRPKEVYLLNISICNKTTLFKQIIIVLQTTVHLSKLFDNISDLEFAKNEHLDNPKLALGMYSKEREFVSFPTECVCCGPVS